MPPEQQVPQTTIDAKIIVSIYSKAVRRQKSDRFGHLISEKLYYYEQISSELEEISYTNLLLGIPKEFGSFYNYTLSFFPDRKPIVNTARS